MVQSKRRPPDWPGVAFSAIIADRCALDAAVAVNVPVTRGWGAAEIARHMIADAKARLAQIYRCRPSQVRLLSAWLVPQ